MARPTLDTIIVITEAGEVIDSSKCRPEERAAGIEAAFRKHSTAHCLNILFRNGKTKVITKSITNQ